MEASEFRDNKREKVTHMKTKKTVFLIVVFSALALFTLNTCKSDTITEPSPLGPSSIGVILSLTAKPNVLLATEIERQTSDITATLKQYDGIPITGTTILFEVVNQAGKRMNLGYLEGEVSLLAVPTNSNGTAKTSYFGPLMKEIRSNTDIYIRATVVWEGSQYIQDATQLYIIRDSK
jgi:hypothetical protein